MSKSMYLINPRVDFPTYYGAEVVEQVTVSPTTFIADLVGPTLAALAPDDFEFTLCDESSTPVDFNCTADYIGITGKSGQVKRMIELADAFRVRDKVVVIGGPYASLVPDAMRPHCDILVQGEIEGIADKFFNDLLEGTWQSEYIGNQPDLSLSPTPRWDLYPSDKALMGCVQTSRGCPFECEFCDVIQYAGRKQRHKSNEQILAELDVLYRQGYNQIFLADDNLTVYRRRTKEMLIAIRDWNNRQADGRITFFTQLSIDTAREDEILQLCAEAGLISVFIGIETPNEESLKETKKRQNMGINLVDQIQRFLDYGISVTGGMIVGFDSDDATIFQKQLKFAMQTPIPIFTLTALIAPEATPLYDRMMKDNRLKPKFDRDLFMGTPWRTNIIPKQLTEEQLFSGIRWLGNQLYHPAAFEQRMLQFIERYTSPQNSQPLRATKRAVEMDLFKVIQNTPKLGAKERKMFFNVVEASIDSVYKQALTMNMLFQYNQIRYMYQQGQFWEPQLAEHTRPTFGPIDLTMPELL